MDSNVHRAPVHEAPATRLLNHIDDIYAMWAEVPDKCALLERMMKVLDRLRDSLPAPEWSDTCQQYLRRHPFFTELLYGEPLTRHSYDRPRGYPGDAELLDYIYGLRGVSTAMHAPDHVAINSFLVQVQPSHAVRERRQLIAGAIDDMARSRTEARILAVGAGHLREVESLSWIHAGRPRIVAFDQDAASLDVVRAAYGSRGIETYLGSVRSLLSGKEQIGTFDLIYAAGLYDYLNDRTAVRLTEQLYQMLVPGNGRLLVANFTPAVRCQGYMEAYLRWHLLYRTAEDMARLAEASDVLRSARYGVSIDSTGAVAYLDLRA